MVAKEKDFEGLEVTDQYGEKVIISEIVGNIAHTNSGISAMYHISKLFHNGKSVYEHLNSNDDEQ